MPLEESFQFPVFVVDGIFVSYTIVCFIWSWVQISFSVNPLWVKFIGKNLKFHWFKLSTINQIEMQDEIINYVFQNWLCFFFLFFFLTGSI